MTEQEKVIESLQRLRAMHISDTCNGYRLSVALTKTIEALEEQDKHRWIPVSESQPPETDNYLATVESSDGTAVITFVNVEHYNHGNDWTGCFKGKKNRREVIAWMPLPEPYKERD